MKKLIEKLNYVKDRNYKLGRSGEPLLIPISTDEAKQIIEALEAKEHNLFRNFIRANHLSKKWDKFLDEWEEFKKQEGIE